MYWPILSFPSITYVNQGRSKSNLHRDPRQLEDRQLGPARPPLPGLGQPRRLHGRGVRRRTKRGGPSRDGWTEFRIILHWGPLSKYYDAHQKSQLKFDQKPLTPKSASPRPYPICRETHEDSKKYKYIVSRPPKPSLFFVAMSANASARVSYVLLPERVEGGGKPVCLSD